jgi:hypothetical protein
MTGAATAVGVAGALTEEALEWLASAAATAPVEEEVEAQMLVAAAVVVTSLTTP